MANIKQLSARPDDLAPGHRRVAVVAHLWQCVRSSWAATTTTLCAARQRAAWNVSTSIYPDNAWNVPFIHNAFANAGATISGVEAAYKGLQRAGKTLLTRRSSSLPSAATVAPTTLVWQSLSGAMERGHDIVYVCYDNGAYMNTGIQRSSATPKGAWATTSEVGKEQQGKPQKRKDLTSIMAAHGVPYVAQATVGNWRDLVSKAEKAIAVDGPAFLNVMAPCPRGWRIDSSMTAEICRMAVNSKFWPLFEVENGKWKLTPVRDKNLIPVKDFLKPQGRFKHLFKPGNEALLEEIQQDVDDFWAYLEGRVEGSKDL